jgi:drug/metabolite transporter (DMT)-like permease
MSAQPKPRRFPRPERPLGLMRLRRSPCHAAALASLAMVAIRDMHDAEPPNRIVFHFSTFCTLVSAAHLLWDWHSPDLHLWPRLQATGIFGTLGQLLIARAFQLAPPGRIGPFTYRSVVFAALLRALFWHEALLAHHDHRQPFDLRRGAH